MNKPIRRLAVFSLALFGVLLLNTTWIQAFQADWLREHEFNRRDVAERTSLLRGPIVVGNEQIATSTYNEDGEYYQREYPEGGAVRAPGGRVQPDGELRYRTDLQLLPRRFRRKPHGPQLPGHADRNRAPGCFRRPHPEPGRPAGSPGRAEGVRHQRPGAAVALDPKTGAVLAAASIPTYDPNSVADLSDVNTSVENWNKLADDKNQTLLNRAFNELYLPGSTFKIVTAATALENGHTIESTIDAPASIQIGGSQLPNAFSGRAQRRGTRLDRALDRDLLQHLDGELGHRTGR